ncbi:membrane protein [Marinomonas pontica]|uniref:Membrane protein n=1 Tax=Marinomonas pontica TaxID=264739 RepID=A0ABM8FG09_9GAMM|nr:membrane protein [Marinomonas pontica]
MTATSPLLKWAALFALQAALSVAAGAFGAHALTAILDAKALGWWHTASQYLMYHALAGLLVVALFSFLSSCKRVLVLFFLGNVFFAGSLYIMALTGLTYLGAVTPIGGFCYLLAWCLLAVSLWRSPCIKSKF